MVDIDSINRQRKANTHILNNIIAKLDDHATNPLQLVDLEGFNKRLETTGTKADQIEDDAVKLCDVKDDAAIKVQVDESEKFHTLLQTVRRKLNQVHLQLNPVINQPSGNNNVTTADMKLPRLEIPVFSGVRTDWGNFHDFFTTTIHNNPKLSPAQKLKYLKGSLTGQAADLIASITISDANYQTAWDLIVDRYQNQRKLILSHLKVLLNLEPLKSSTGLRNLLDTITKQLNHLKSLGRDIAFYNDMLVAIILERLDKESKKEWNMHSPGKDFPSYDDLKSFLEARASGLDDEDESRRQQPQSQRPPVQPPRFKFKQGGSTYHVGTAGKKTTQQFKSGEKSPQNKGCQLCKEAHQIYHCPKFNGAGATERRKLAQDLQLCFNCLGSNHSAGQCYSTRTCKRCNGKHHTSLHEDQATSTTAAYHCGLGGATLLATAIVEVKHVTGTWFKCRGLLDNGAERSLVSEALVQQLGVKRQNTRIQVGGVTGSEQSRGLTKVEVRSCTTDTNFTPTFIIMSTVGGNIPTTPVNADWSALANMSLADPDFNKPRKIDMILDADYYHRLTIGSTIIQENQPMMQNSQLGWLIVGRITTSNDSKFSVSVHTLTINVQDQLAKFWELEEPSEVRKLTKEEIICEGHFAKTHRRDADGRYVVCLPFKTDAQRLGKSKEQAIRRFHQQERRLERNLEARIEYNKFMAQYLALGHMELIPSHQRLETLGKTYYIPHHFVRKETSTSTKFRVVFDGSATTTTDLSLNDNLMIGPRLQTDITDILQRFRLYKYVFTADIEKFFRQISMDSDDRDYQRILWRNSPDLPLEEYRLNTVTYGTASAPYLASRALQQLGTDEGEKYPMAKEVIPRDFYVDDIMTGAHDLESVLELQSQLRSIMELGNFPMLKWASNCTEVLERVPSEHRETQLPLAMEADDAIKALGLFWHPAADYFFFRVNLPPDPAKVTKRTMLSDTAKLYDPLGLLAPVIVKAKILFRDLWQAKLDWDDILPSNLLANWLDLRNNLHRLQELKISRLIINNKDAIHQLHGFCDASDLAYCAVVYLRSEDQDGTTTVNIIQSKTRVAPLKTQSIPKLELCGASLLAPLVKKISRVLNINISSTHLWTDSTVVLGWLAGKPHQWKVFVANRLTEIQSLYDRENWSHVRSEDNPADCGSRGLSPAQLLDFDLWWNGPSWLPQLASEWPTLELAPAAELPEGKPVQIQNIRAPPDDIIFKYSDLSRLQRVVGYCLLFLRNCRVDKNQRKANLTTHELNQALKICTRRVQEMEFADVISAIKKGKEIPKVLRTLHPFLDHDGIIRVGGRLENARMSYDRRHPMILPQKHHFTSLVVNREHIRGLHAGPQLMNATLMRTFWILNARKPIRKCVHTCLICFRNRASTMEQLMGSLPASRVRPGRPFLTCRVDYAGPITLKSHTGRGGGRSYKAYIAVFVCFVTKAIHMELVTGLSTDSFLAALRRFIARRGKPMDIYSDNGTNFVGADNQLQEFHAQFFNQGTRQTVLDTMRTEGVNWHFIPPRAPHHGGLWEAGVKSAKQHMRRVIGDTILTYEEMLTYLHQIEAVLNSRPITPASTDPNDLEVLTPGHFLIGDSLMADPEPDLTDLKANTRSRYQLVQSMMQHFWQRWQLEYLNTLQQRTKWTKELPNLLVGDLVLVKEDNVPPLQWKRARILETHDGADGKIRVATIKEATGTGFETTTLKRDIRKLCKLPI